MPPRVDSPVQTQLAIPVPDGVLRTSSGGRPVGRRRIFVQTDTGSVLGIELDRADNVQTVKKKMQTMLNVPTEQTALVFGDTVLKSDLSKLRNDSPLLLTRELQRSLSTPCIFPSPDVQAQVDRGQPFEVVGGLRCCPRMKKALKEIVKAIECGVEPVAVSGGLGGAYYFRNSRGESVAIVKPTDEEPFAPNNPKGFVGKALGQPGLKRAVRVGETGVREVAAYLLDHENFAKVPPTVLVKVSHHVFNINSGTPGHKGHVKEGPMAKIASCQQFVHHDFDASDHGTSRFSVLAVHRIGILDIRIFNTDRHAGNILVRNVKPLDNQGAWNLSNVHVNEALELIPIDHGLCLPEALEDPYFEWLHWPQASVPFSEEELDYIQRLDENRDVDMLRAELPMLREACFRMLVLSTILLKNGAAAGLCLAEIGEIMSRDGMEEASQLELLCLQARLLVEKEMSACNDDAFSEISIVDDEISEQFAFEMDEEDVPSNGDRSLIGRLNSLSSPRSGSKNIPSFAVKDYQVASGNGAAASNVPVFLSDAIRSGDEDNGRRIYWPVPVPLSSPKTPRKDHHIRIKAFDAPPKSEEEDEGSFSACRSPAGKSSFGNRGCMFPHLSVFGSSSDLKSPRGNRVDRSCRSRQDFCPLVEEEEVNVFADSDLKADKASGKTNVVSPRAMSYRSVSFSDRKQRYSIYPERKGFGLPASETTGKGNASGSSNPLSFGDMNNEEWACFIDHFQDLLQEALAVRCNQNVSLRQRLGISCQF